MEHALYPFFDAGLAESQRAGDRAAPPRAACKQRLRVRFFPVRPQLSDDFFVTGELNVPAKQKIGEPAQGIEPVDAEDEKAQRLPQMISPAQMRVFVREEMCIRDSVTPPPVSVLQQKIDFTGEESCLSFYRRTAARGAAGLPARTEAPRRPCL